MKRGRNPDPGIHPGGSDPAARFVIVQDTREQDGWGREFLSMVDWDGRPITAGQIQVGTLKTGDCSIAGHENKIAVERKSLADWWGSITFGRERLLAEIDRARELKFFAVIIEASWRDICQDNPRIHRMSGKTSGRTLLSWRLKYPWCHFITADGRREAAGLALRTLERWHMIRADLEPGVTPAPVWPDPPFPVEACKHV